MVAVLQFPLVSHTVYSKESVPVNPGVGMYVMLSSDGSLAVPFSFNTTVPFDGSVAVIEPVVGISLSFALQDTTASTPTSVETESLLASTTGSTSRVTVAVLQSPKELQMV